MALFQQRQQDWRNTAFLKSGSNLKEGRKLNLSQYSARRPFKTIRHSQNVPRPTYVAPHEKRRDDVRYEMRMKLMS